MKNKLIILILLVVSFQVFSQKDNVTGRVIDTYGNPIVDANVYLIENSQGVKTDNDGKFNINNLKGAYTLQISFIGFKTKEIKINAPVDLSDVILYEGNELLQEVVLERKGNKFSRKKTAYVSKLPLKDLENTHVYSTVTSGLLESQVVTNLDEAMANATGIYKLWEGTGRAPGNGTAYFASRGFSLQPRMVDGVAGVTFSAVDPSYIERIEVIKGPSATLFGSTETSIGGLINVVTKKPFEGKGGSISYTGGSFGLNRISLDYNTPLGKSNAPFFRVNASYLTQDSFQDAGFKNTFFIAPSLSHRVNNRLNISMNMEYSQTESTNPSMLFLRQGIPLVATNIDELNIDPNKSFTSNDITLDNSTFNTRAIFDYKISDTWTSKTAFSSSYAQTSGLYQYQFDGGAAGLLLLSSITDQLNYLGLDDATLGFINSQIDPLINPMLQEASTLLTSESFTRVYSERDASETRFNLQQNFIGDFKIGNIRNRMVVGVDYISNSRNSRNVNGNTELTSTSNFPQLMATFNALGLSPFSEAIESNFSTFPYFDAFLSANGDVISTTFTPNAAYDADANVVQENFDQIDPIVSNLKSQTLAAYFSDVINITPRLTVNVGLRLDHFIQDGNLSTTADDYTKTTLSPNAGVLYQPIKNKLSVFGNYQTGFVNVDPIVNADGSTDVFQPTKAVQFEGGVKTNLFNGKLNLGASYYHITVNDFTTTDPYTILFPVTIDMEESISKGFEFEINTSPIKNLNIRGSYSINDRKYTDVYSEKAIDPITGEAGREVVEFLGRRPTEAGAERLYNFWADYKFDNSSFAKNFGLGLGFNGASENLSRNNSVAGVFTIPSYMLFNASIYYNIKNFRVAVKANNFTNEIYYNGWGTVNAQAPRSFLGTISYKF